MEPPVVSITASITPSSALPALGLAPGLGLVPSPGHLPASAKRAPSLFRSSSVIIFFILFRLSVYTFRTSHGSGLCIIEKRSLSPEAATSAGSPSSPGTKARRPSTSQSQDPQSPSSVVPSPPPPSLLPVSLGSRSRLPHVLNCFLLELIHPFFYDSSPPAVRVLQRALNARANPG